jgi:hypothetical protein
MYTYWYIIRHCSVRRGASIKFSKRNSVLVLQKYLRVPLLHTYSLQISAKFSGIMEVFPAITLLLDGKYFIRLKPTEQPLTFL